MSSRPDPMTAALTLAAVAGLTLTALAATRPLAADEFTVATAPSALTGPQTAAPAAGQDPAAAPTATADPSAQATPVADSGAADLTPRADVPRAAATWVEQVASATAIPAAAVAAYADATLALGAEDPACGLGWTTLAAIGGIESDHGRHGGAVLGADGRPSAPIIGPALDGYGVAEIRSTERSVALHGDPTWEHAIGPMQFLPSTWWRWEADGDGDGVADPQDVADAALAAGRYLCAGDRDLTSADGWTAAVLSYNHSQAYLADVLALADGYAAASP